MDELHPLLSAESESATLSCKFIKVSIKSFSLLNRSSQLWLRLFATFFYFQQKTVFAALDDIILTTTHATMKSIFILSTEKHSLITGNLFLNIFSWQMSFVFPSFVPPTCLLWIFHKQQQLCWDGTTKAPVSVKHHVGVTGRSIAQESLFMVTGKDVTIGQNQPLKMWLIWPFYLKKNKCCQFLQFKYTWLGKLKTDHPVGSSLAWRENHSYWQSGIKRAHLHHCFTEKHPRDVEITNWQQESQQRWFQIVLAQKLRMFQCFTTFISWETKVQKRNSIHKRTNTGMTNRNRSSDREQRKPQAVCTRTQRGLTRSLELKLLKLIKTSK